MTDLQIYDHEASFSTTGDGLRGTPVMLMDKDDGSLTWSRVYSNTSTVLTLDTPLNRSPDDFDAYLLGSIPLSIVSGDLTFGAPAVKKTLRYILAQFERGASGHLDVYVASDQENQTTTAWQFVGSIPLTGRTEYRLPVNVSGGTGRIIRYQIIGTYPGQVTCITALVLKVDHETPL
ncbi:MAG: hypothetical protein GY820_39625 [Gammaproteobacteria bacterium]|nr:hypothetical protein [Gammaproteobacteria bacterium]